jgi:hypothetical protein
VDEIITRFNALYILENTPTPDLSHHIPSMFIFDRIASDMGYEEVYSHEISTASSRLGITKKSITFNNTDNQFLKKLKRGEYNTVTPRMLAKYIQKYTDHRRITLVCIVGIVERLPVLKEDETEDTSTFAEVKSFLLDTIRKTTCYSALKDTLRIGEEVAISYASRVCSNTPDSTISSPTNNDTKDKVTTDTTIVKDELSSNDIGSILSVGSSIRVIRRPFLFSLK